MAIYLCITFLISFNVFYGVILIDQHCIIMPAAYAVVEFTSKEIGVVSSKWFTPEKSQVYWPPYKDNYYFKKSLQREEEPNQSTWPLYPIKRCFYETGDLNKALSKQQEAEVTSNLSSSDEELLIQKTRKRKIPKRYLTISSEDENDQTNIGKEFIERPPKININKESITSYSQTSTSNRANQSKITKKFLSQTSPSLTCSTTSRNDLSHENSGTRNDDDLNNTTCETFQTPKHTGDSATDTLSRGERQIIERIIKVEEQNNQILSILREQKLEKDIGGNVQVVENLPLKTVEELIQFEETLSSDEILRSLVYYLSHLGGDGIVSKTNKILKRLLTDNLASKYNFCGHKNKLPFNCLKLKDIIIQSVKNKCHAASVHEVEQAIKNWLKYAPKRIQITLKKNNENERASAIL